MYNDVCKFIDACDQIPSNETINLYNSLIIEEFLEFKKARLENDTIEELDACKVIKRPDGKVLKPEGWTSPNLASFI